jgi:hypothetical protein
MKKRTLFQNRKEGKLKKEVQKKRKRGYKSVSDQARTLVENNNRDLNKI